MFSTSSSWKSPESNLYSRMPFPTLKIVNLNQIAQLHAPGNKLFGRLMCLLLRLYTHAIHDLLCTEFVKQYFVSDYSFFHMKNRLETEKIRIQAFELTNFCQNLVPISFLFNISKRKKTISANMSRELRIQFQALKK